MSIAAREEDSFLSHDRSIGPFPRIVEDAPRARARESTARPRASRPSNPRDGDDVRPRDASRRDFGSRARSDDRIGRCPLTRARARETRGKA